MNRLDHTTPNSTRNGGNPMKRIENSMARTTQTGSRNCTRSRIGCGIMTGVITVAALSFGGAADATLISYGGDVVSKTQNLTRGWSLSGSTATVSFSDASALSPASDYTGPEFFGGASSSITGSATTSSNGNSAAVQQQDSGFDRISLTYNIGNDDPSAKTMESAGLVYFKTGTGFDVSSNDAFSADVSNAFGGSTAAARWLVRDGSGSLYVSNETFAFGGASSSNLTGTTWALLDTSGSDFFQTYGSFGSLSLTGLTGAGVYYEGVRNGLTSTGNANGTGFRVNQFEVVPEPASLVLLGLGGLCLLGGRRRLA